MRTQRWPTCSSDAPVCSARASSAAEIADAPSSSAAVKVHCTIVSRLKPAARSLAGDGAARPRTATVARTRCSGPISSMPWRSRAAGACSRNSSAASTSSSTAAGRSSSASGCEHVDACCGDVARQLARRSTRAAGAGAGRRRPRLASGLPSHTSAALHHRPGSASSTSSRSTRHGSRRSSGTTRRSRRTSTGSPRARCAEAAEDVGDRAEGVGMGGPRRPHAVVLTGEGAEHEPDDGGRRRATARDDRAPSRPAAGGRGRCCRRTGRRSIR